MAEKTKPQVTPLQGILMLVAAIALSSMLWWSAGSGASGESAPAQTNDSAQRVQAYDACREAITPELLAPQEATFASIVLGDATATRQSNDSYLVQAYVDAPNAAGVNVRLNFSCTVEQRGADWQVTAHKIVP